MLLYHIKIQRLTFYFFAASAYWTEHNLWKKHGEYLVIDQERSLTQISVLRESLKLHREELSNHREVSGYEISIKKQELVFQKDQLELGMEILKMQKEKMKLDLAIAHLNYEDKTNTLIWFVVHDCLSFHVELLNFKAICSL